MKKTIHLVAAARPNFMKVAPLYHAFKREDWCRLVLVHTGQHYDVEMSGAFLHELGLPNPDIHLGVGSGTHAEQTARVIIAYERVCIGMRPDWVIVVGDVNSTLACTLAAKKLSILVAHLEAGLRCGDRTMPEEINRIVTDALADLLWTPSPDADENLKREGIAEEKIARVGNIMIDSYELLKKRIESENAALAFDLKPENYGVVTLHRPVNVDSQEALCAIVNTLVSVSNELSLVFPIHPRTRERLNTFGLMTVLGKAPFITLANSLNYVRFMSLVRESKLVITDSGGVQEETTYLNIPCITLRDTTERPITVIKGTNRLVGIGELQEAVVKVLEANWPSGICPDLWDGRTSIRVVSSLKERISKNIRADA
jgi:UDP-N-acetylglucosamine 2-epimerase (non-hydrolysing)